MELPLRYSSISSFDKDLKRLSKKFASLPADLEVAKTAAIELFHSLKGRGVKSGIRIIYFLDLCKMEVVFLEMYFKPDQENEDRGRIKEYLQMRHLNK